MRNITKALPITALIAALLAGGTAYAVEQGAAKPGGPMQAEVTRAEAQAKASEMFARLDANKDGKLDPADRDAQRSAMFDRIDTDKNGQISRAEFEAHHPAGHRMGRGGMGHRGMGHDGMGREGMGRGGMAMARMADTNKDNAISQAEFAAASMTMFDRADANKDGTVTREERRTARIAMRQMMRSNASPAGN